MKNIIALVAGMLLTSVAYADIEPRFVEELQNAEEDTSVNAPEVGDSTSDNYLDAILSDQES